MMLTSVLGVAGDENGDDVNALVSIGSVLISIGKHPSYRLLHNLVYV